MLPNKPALYAEVCRAEEEDIVSRQVGVLVTKIST